MSGRMVPQRLPKVGLSTQGLQAASLSKARLEGSLTVPTLVTDTYGIITSTIMRDLRVMRDSLRVTDNG